MKIALIGYGKMGKLIEQLAKERGHEIILTIDQQNQSEIQSDLFKTADVAIEFTTPHSVLSNIKLVLATGVPMVVGTTGWYEHIPEIKKECETGNKSLLYASNFSIGVNVFFYVNRILAKLMNQYPQYEVQVEEIHHTQKLDSPSGTAITIAEGIIENLERKNKWVNELVEGETNLVSKADELLIESHRIDQVPGTHTVIYSSEVDEIAFKHTAHSRAGFALGAIVAAEWLQDKQGFYAIDDMFDFKQ